MIIESLSALFHGIALFSGGTQITSPLQATLTKSIEDYGFVRCEIEVNDFNLLFDNFLDLRYEHYEYDEDNNLISYVSAPIFRFVLEDYGEHIESRFLYGYSGGQTNISFSGQFTLESLDDEYTRSINLMFLYVEDDQYKDNVFASGVDSIPQPTGFNLVVDFYFMDTTIYESFFSNVDNTYVKGYQDGLDVGYSNGYDSGYNNGTIEGQQSGYQHGYTVGYQNGKNDAPSDYGFMSLFSSIADTPIMMIYRMFNFDLFGTSVVVVVLTLISVLILINVLKKVLK